MVVVSFTRTNPSQVCDGAVRSVAVGAGGEVGAVGRVVRSLADDDRVLAGFKHTGTICLVCKGGLKAARLKAAPGSAAILTCMMVRVFGP